MSQATVTRSVRAFAINVVSVPVGEPAHEEQREKVRPLSNGYHKTGIATEVGKTKNRITDYNKIAIAWIDRYKAACISSTGRLSYSGSLSPYQREVLLAISDLFDYYRISRAAGDEVRKTIQKYNKEFNDGNFNAGKFISAFCDQ